jgi:hypothetical protein
VFDLPEPKPVVAAPQAEVKPCAGGCRNRAAFPPEVTAPVQYGPRVKSVAVYLKEYQLLSFDRLTEIMRDLFACHTLSEGTLVTSSKVQKLLGYKTFFIGLLVAAIRSILATIYAPLHHPDSAGLSAEKIPEEIAVA